MRTLKVAVVAVVREKRVMLRIARLQSLLVYHSTSYYLLPPSHKALCPTDRTFKKKKRLPSHPTGAGAVTAAILSCPSILVSRAS